jgi:hypothetical protein
MSESAWLCTVGVIGIDEYGLLTFRTPGMSDGAQVSCIEGDGCEV